MPDIEKTKKEIGENLLRSLQSYKDSEVVEYVEILATRDSCEACKKGEGNKISVKNAITTNPLPVKECFHKCGYCRCCYIPVVD